MALKTYLIFMGLSTVLCWAAWLLVIFSIDPDNAGFIGLIAFYLTLLFSLTGTFFFISFIVRRILNKEAVVSRQVGISFRQAISYATVVLGALWLQSQNWLNWANIILFIAVLTILEIFFVSARRRLAI
ncbi:MAG: hypothetical protein V1692_02875 [bacterium]